MRIDRYVHDERLTWGAAGVLFMVAALHAAGIGRLFVTPPEAPRADLAPVFQVSLQRLPPPRLPPEVQPRTEDAGPPPSDAVKQRPRQTRPVPILVDTPVTNPVPPDTQVKPYEIGDELLPGEPGPPMPEGVEPGEGPYSEAAPVEETPVYWKMTPVDMRPIYAEDPANKFLPSTGKLAIYEPPEGPRVPVDNGVRQGDKIELFYDPLLSKVITWGPTRNDALASMRRALAEFRVVGISTTIPFCQFVLSDSEFRAGRYTTHFVEERFTTAPDGSSDRELTEAAIAAALFFTKAAAREGKGPAESGRGETSRWKDKRTEHHR